tara:strand:- start:1228 stop:3105 length:1878 start_codon:yes stop_codon:yes gene_type:complete
VLLKRILFILLLFFVGIHSANSIEVNVPEFVIENQTATIEVADFKEDVTVLLNNTLLTPIEVDGNLIYEFKLAKKGKIEIISQTETFSRNYNPIPLWLSILPPLIAILLALVIREVVSSLLIGLFSGCVIIYLHLEGGLLGFLKAFMAMLDTYILESLNNSGHLSIIIFSMLIGGMVAVISKNGGMQGIVNRISRYATSARSGQLATWFLGIAIFFDDYANTLIVGNTMRPITDKFKISREKLAYIVDSTAAPIAAIAFVTTWIGAELGYIESGINKIPELNEGVYATFINSLSYSFYPILALAFMLILILKERDFGPMYKAEYTSRNSIADDTESEMESISEFTALEDINHSAYNAVIPVLTVIVGTLIGLLYTGWDSAVWESAESLGTKLSLIIGQADSYQALLWSSAAGLIVAIKLTVLQKIMKLQESIESVMEGFKTMLPAIVILILAWSLALVIEDLHTADLLTSIMSNQVSAYLIPAVTFLLAAIVAFSTGSSWGTMAILYPLMLPAAWEISKSSGLDYNESLAIFHNVVSCVLAGSVLGDHCSPISDTTILSSLASSCNHVNHVRTQMPYALVVGIVALVTGTLLSALGVPTWLCFLIGISCLYCVIQFFGKKVLTNE